MKITKITSFLAVCFTLLLGLSFTSCLNSDSDSTSTNSAMVKVYSYYGTYIFKTPSGVTITPTSSSITTLESNGVDLSSMNGKVAQIYYQWDSSVLTIDDTTKDIEGVTLTYAVSLDNTVEIVEEEGAVNDSVNNASIISLENSQGGYAYKPFFYDATDILLPVNYYIYSKMHYLTLVYYPNQENNGTLKLYLRHNNNGDTNTSTTSYEYLTSSSYYSAIALYLKIYDLTDVFERYMEDTGNSQPTSVEIVTQESSYSTDLDKSESKTYTVNYETSE